MTACKLISSLNDLTSEDGGTFIGSAICIPFGAGPSEPAWFFRSVGDITTEDFEIMLKYASPAPCGTRRIHLIEPPPRFSSDKEFIRVET